MIPTTVLIFVVATATANPPADFKATERLCQAEFKEAERLCQADQFGEAEPLYRSSLKTTDLNLKRRAYDGLMRLYVRSDREDKAIRQADEYGEWLRAAGDTNELAELDLTLGQCWLGLGYQDRAGRHLDAALAATPSIPLERRLEALRLRAEVAAFRHDREEGRRWADLEAAATVVVQDAIAIGDLRLRVTAARYLGESLFRQNKPEEALAKLDKLPELLEKLSKSTGRRDTQFRDIQLLRAKLCGALKDYRKSVHLFKDALAIHGEVQPNNHMVAGDILAEWGAAAVANGNLVEGARLRDEAAAEYKVVLNAPSATFQFRLLQGCQIAEYKVVLNAPSPTAEGSRLAAFVRLQNLHRSARHFRIAYVTALTDGQRWSGDDLLASRLKADQGGLELMSSEYKNSLTQLEKAFESISETQLPNLRARPQLLVHLATAVLAVASPDRADKLLTECVNLYSDHKLPDDPTRVECDYLRGVAAAREGKFKEALGWFRNGLTRADTVGALANPVRFNLLLNIALIHKEQGDLDAAGEELKKAADLLAQVAKSDEWTAELIKAFREEEALIYAVRTDLLVTQERVSEALKLIPRIEAYCDEEGRKTGYLWATSRHVRGLGCLAAGDIAGAEAIWTKLAETQREEEYVLLPRTLNYLGMCAELQDRDRDAEKLYKKSLAFQTSHLRGPPVTRAITLWRLALLEDNAGRKTEAKALLNELFDLADEARLNTFGEAAQRAVFFSQFAPTFELAANWAFRDNDGERLLQVIARSRSRTLLDETLAAGVDPRGRLQDTDDLIIREKKARTEISKLQGQVLALHKQVRTLQTDDAEEKKKNAQLEEAQKEFTQKNAQLKAAQKEFTEIWRKIASANPLTRSLDPRAADGSLALRREIHKSDGALLIYMLGHDECFAVLCTDPAAPPEVFRLKVAKSAEGLEEVSLPPGKSTGRPGSRGAQIESTAQPERPTVDTSKVPLTHGIARPLVDSYLRQIASSKFNPRLGIPVVLRTGGMRPIAAEVLGDAVLPADLRDSIRKSGKKRLVVIPDGALHKLPFEALLVSGGTDPLYALDDLPVSICYAPSLAVLAAVMARQQPTSGPRTLLTTCNPTYPLFPATLSRLPSTQHESDRIRTFFKVEGVTALEQKAATKANVVKAIPGKQVIHLAAHGFAQEEYENRFAWVALTPPPPGEESSNDDGFLYLHEIHRLNLKECELTVLSACETYVGPQRPLEAGVTLAGAFLSAGSRGVIASYWPVDDPATAELMATHFEVVYLDSKATSHADALKTARQAIKSTPRWKAPCYWAAFGYLGPPK